MTASKCGTSFESAPNSNLYEPHGHTCTRSKGHKDSRHVCRCGASSINTAKAKRKETS
jgi:hypothetical protein